MWELLDESGKEAMKKTVTEAKERKAREEQRKEESKKRDRSLSADDVSLDS